MPQLSDIVKKRSEKKFTKKNFRPWDLSGSGTVDDIVEPQPDGVVQNAHIQEQHTSANDTNLAVKTEDVEPNISDNVLDNELGNKRVTNREHTGNIRVANREQIDNKQVTNSEHLDNVISNEIDNAQELKLLAESIKKLVGIQKQLFHYIVNLCSVSAELETGVILTAELATISKRTIGSVKTSLKRLIDKKLLIRRKGKCSRGGHINLGITKAIQAAALQSQQLYFNPIMKEISGNELGNKIDNNAYASSSNILNTTTTDLPAEWKNINIIPLKEINFGITELKNIYKKRPEHVSHEMVQDSIKQFAFGLKNNSVRYKNMKSPAAILVSALCQGSLWTEAGYVSEEEKLKREKEEQLTNTIEKNFKESKFIEWFNKLPEEEKEDIVPITLKESTGYINSKRLIQQEQARKKFNAIVWPDILLEIKSVLMNAKNVTVSNN